MKRVYHPSLDSFMDVADDAVDSWAEQGWLKTKPKHVHIEAGTPKPGEHPGFATVAVELPVLEDVSSTTTSGRGSRRGSGGGSRGSRGSRTSGGGSTTTATSSTATGATPTA